MGNAFVTIALLGWLPLVVGMFAALPPRRAVIWAFLVAWLFLPMAGYKLAGLPDYTKMSATCFGVLLGAALFDTARLVSFRPRWIDLPMLVFCLCPMASSLSNGLGWYDGASSALAQTISWGLPYFIGRLYFRNLEDLRELAVALFIGGLIYVPLCLFEIRMSPQLHTWIYGYHQHDFAQAKRFGGFRPTVFMQHGLMVGMWMCMTTLIGFWLWSAKALPRTICRIPLSWSLVLLFATAVLCKSTGALLLLATGLGVCVAMKYARLSFAVWALIAISPIYCATRAAALWDGEQLVSWTDEWLGAERAQSLEYRLKNETMLAEKAMLRPAFGWGGWGRARVYNEQGRDLSVTDGLWVIALGNFGIVGLGSLSLAMLLPAGMAMAGLGGRDWFRLETAAVPALAVVVVLYWIDCIPNGMVNPIFTLAVGALGSMYLAMSRLPVVKSMQTHSGREVAETAGG